MSESKVEGKETGTDERLVEQPVMMQDKKEMMNKLGR
jgi:hypothetical protein